MDTISPFDSPNRGKGRADKNLINLFVKEAKADINATYTGERLTLVQNTAIRDPKMLQWMVDQNWVNVESTERLRIR